MGKLAAWFFFLSIFKAFSCISYTAYLAKWCRKNCVQKNVQKRGNLSLIDNAEYQDQRKFVKGIYS